MKFGFKKMNVWAEIGTLSVINLILLVLILSVYRLTTRWPALILFIAFLGVGILHSYNQKFEKANFFLSPKGKVLMFMKSCLPYMLQTVFFAQCSLLIGWILLNI